MKEFMTQPAVESVFKKNEEGLIKYFKFYIGLATKEMGLDLEYQMN
jgi:hypothetical protein